MRSNTSGALVKEALVVGMLGARVAVVDHDFATRILLERELGRDR
jgi:hypothetical protein